MIALPDMTEDEMLALVIADTKALIGEIVEANAPIDAHAATLRGPRDGITAAEMSALGRLLSDDTATLAAVARGDFGEFARQAATGGGRPED